MFSTCGDSNGRALFVAPSTSLENTKVWDTRGEAPHHLRLVTPPSSRRLMVEDGMQRGERDRLSVLSDRWRWSPFSARELASPATIYSLADAVFQSPGDYYAMK